MTFIDFFSGIGGFRVGMQQAGHTCVGHCDLRNSKEIEMIDYEGWKAHEEQAKKEDSEGKSELCTGNLDGACTYCHRYWDCPYMKKGD